jgi:hypothetical protein
VEVTVVRRAFLMGVTLLLGCGLVVSLGCTDETATDSYVPQATTTVTTAPSDVPSVVQQSTSVTRLAVTTVAAPTTTESPIVYLGESDNDRQMRLHVGDQVRIELEPEVDKVIAVRWDFPRVVVEYLDSGWTEMEGATIADCWLELEVRNAGSVTIRARYEYVAGYVNSPWACYLVATEAE